VRINCPVAAHSDSDCYVGKKMRIRQDECCIFVAPSAGAKIYTAPKTTDVLKNILVLIAPAALLGGDKY
jgi:hypothetical protein